MATPVSMPGGHLLASGGLDAAVQRRRVLDPGTAIVALCEPRIYQLLSRQWHDQGTARDLDEAPHQLELERAAPPPVIEVTVTAPPGGITRSELGSGWTGLPVGLRLRAASQCVGTRGPGLPAALPDLRAVPAPVALAGGHADWAASRLSGRCGCREGCARRRPPDGEGDVLRWRHHVPGALPARRAVDVHLPRVHPPRQCRHIRQVRAAARLDDCPRLPGDLL